jgi:hypothetical protein
MEVALTKVTRESEQGSFLQMTLCCVVLFATSLLGILLQDVPAFLIPAGVCLLAASLVFARAAARRFLGTTKTLCILFFSLATAHIFFGFLAANLTAGHTSIRSNAEVYFANSFLINSVGLLAAALGYAWKLSRNTTIEFSHTRSATVIDPAAAERAFRILLLAGAVLMFVVYWKLGLLEYLSNPAKWPFLRYITSGLAGGSARDEWFANRAMDLLTVAMPFLVYRAAKRPGILRISLIVVGYLALLLPLRRANLLAVIFASLILIGIGRRDVYRLTRKWILIGGCFYIFTQCLFLFGAFYNDLSVESLLEVSSTALPEVRDLAWTLNRLDGERLNGVTFAQALIPLPSISSDWSSRHSLRAITTKLIGVDQSGESGGLRLTLMGEGYINWGYLGTIAVSFVWGCGVAWCEKLLLSATRSQSEFRNYVAVMCFVWICFLLYLAGTQAAAPVKMGALLVLGVAWICKYRPRSLPLLSEAQT